MDNDLHDLSNDEILDIIPASEYDPFEAKFCASLFWLVFHATEDGGLDDVPSQVTNPISHNSKTGFVVHPEIVQFLTQGEVYCTVCSRVFPGRIPLAGHWSVIQTLSRNGIYVVDGNTDVAITDTALEQTNPFNQSAHMALMDALMTAYSSQVVSIQAVVQAVRRFSTFSASRELPFDLEDCLLLWVNKLTNAINQKYSKSNKAGKLLHSRGQERKIGLRVDNEDSSSCVLPVIDDLLKGLCDGRCLLGIVLYYEPSVVTIEEIFSTPGMVSIDDSVRNLDLFRSLCSQFFCTSVLALKVEDILYGSPSLKINIVALLAEMFSKCENGTKQEQQRSKTSCSENNDHQINGDKNPRSHSAPVSRNKQSQNKDISVKIQNFIENVGSSENLSCEEKQGGEMIAGGEEGTDDMVEVDGVVVKLRKKVARDIQPGGGHEALLSRRMKKSLVSSSQDDLSNGQVLSPSEPDSQFDAKTSNVYENNGPQISDISSNPKDSEIKPIFDNNPDNIDTPAMQDDPHSLELDFASLPESDTPVDYLSPISETTEPGSLANSQNLPPGVFSENSNQTEFRDKRSEHEDLVPPLSYTPRTIDHDSQSFQERSLPRGSYVINSACYTAESAVAAGIPVVERHSLRHMGSSHEGRHFEQSSSNGRQETSSYFPANTSCGDVSVSRTPDKPAVICDQRTSPNKECSQPNESHGDNTRYSTFTKTMRDDGIVDCSENSGTDKPPETFHGNNHQVKPGNIDSPVTWFVRGDDDVISKTNHSSKNVDHVLQRKISDPGGKKTSWAVTEEDGNQSTYVKKDTSGVRSDRSDNVSKELNLLRLKLFEKQRDIEAQKQRTKEQVDEERKRLGQNVFWFAVGKEKQKREPVEGKQHNKHKDFSLPTSPKKTSNVPHNVPSAPGKIATPQHLPRQSPEQELPPSMEKLHLKTMNATLRGSTGNLATRIEPLNGTSRNRDDIAIGKYATLPRHSSDGRVHEFRLSRQTPGSLDSLLGNVKISPRSEMAEDSRNSEKQRASVMNYKSRINVPLTYSNKPSNSENLSDMGYQGDDVGRVTEDFSETRDLGNLRSSHDSSRATGQESEDRKPPPMDFSEMSDIPGNAIASSRISPNANQPPSPTRKCWDTDAFTQGEPQLAVSKSNYHLLDNDNIADISENRQDVSGNRQASFDDRPKISENRPESFESRQWISENRQAIPENTADYFTVNSDDVHAQCSNGNDVSPQGASKNADIVADLTDGPKNDQETPKKGLSLFIGDQNTVGENGLTPEQLKKKERFLKNRQQKLEEERLKKETMMEKKRKKEEKMGEIQLRREREEQSRQAQLQEKREHAELAKMERQKYEQKRKDNLPRTNYMLDGAPCGYHNNTSGYLGNVTPGGHRGYQPKNVGNHHFVDHTTPDVVPYGMTPASPTTGFSGFSGVQSYVKPSGKSNRKLTINAISHVCLPGAVNKDTKDKCLQAMTESSAQHFLILFREGLKFRGLYSLDLESSQVLKVHGVGPRSVTEKMIQHLYKYNSGAKEFAQMPAKTFSLSVDGFTLQKSCWQSSNKHSVPSKTLSNYKLLTSRTPR